MKKLELYDLAVYCQGLPRVVSTQLQGPIGCFSGELLELKICDLPALKSLGWWWVHLDYNVSSAPFSSEWSL